MHKEVEVIAMVYKSTKFAEFIIDQLKKYCKSDTIDCSFTILCNDATDRVIKFVKESGVNYKIYKDKNPNDYYLNRVYRAWNYGGLNCEKENLIFVNSDMAFSEDWIDNLFKHHDGKNIPCSRLIESGKLPVGDGIPNNGWAKAYNFGTHPDNFYNSKWEESSKISKIDNIGEKGLYMPCLFNTAKFKETNGYPEGNLYEGGVGEYNTRFIKSGDDYYFHDILENQFNMKHITVFDSLVYHMQEGEKDELE